MVLVYGAQFCFGVFFKPMIAEFGWTRAVTSVPFSINMLIGGLVGIFAGRLADRYGPRLVVTIGGLVLGCGYLLTSQTTAIWHIYLFYGLITASGVSAMYVPLVSMLARWFPDKRGLVGGIGVSGIGFGIGVMPLIASSMIEASDWRKSMLIVGIICMAGVVLLAQILKTPPAEKAAANEHTADKPAADSAKSYKYSEAMKTWQFWMFCAAWFCYGIFFTVGLVHIVPYASDMGMTATAAATVLTLIGLVGTPARIMLGFLGDRIGSRNMFMIAFGSCGLVFILLGAVPSIWMLYIFGLVFGLFSGVGVLAAPITSEYFGLTYLGPIVGTIIFSNSIGGAISPTIAGQIFDVTGSYQTAFWLCGTAGILASLILWRLKKPAKRREI